MDTFYDRLDNCEHNQQEYKCTPEGRILGVIYGNMERLQDHNAENDDGGEFQASKPPGKREPGIAVRACMAIADKTHGKDEKLAEIQYRGLAIRACSQSHDDASDCPVIIEQSTDI